MATHEQMKDQLVSLVLGELSEQQRSQVTAHVAECDECRTELEQLEQLLGCAGRRKGLSADESLLASARNDLLAAVSSEQPRIIARPDFRRAFEWRRIMVSPIMKTAVAALIAVAAGLFGVSKIGDHRQPQRWGILATAVANEESLFKGTEIIHIQNEIIVHAGGAAAESDGAGPGFHLAANELNEIRRQAAVQPTEDDARS